MPGLAICQGCKEAMCSKIGEVEESDIICNRFLALRESCTPSVTQAPGHRTHQDATLEQEAGVMSQ